MTQINKLLAQFCPQGVESAELKDILIIKNGSDYKNYDVGDIPVYGSGGIIAYIDRYAFDKPSVLIPRKGSIDKLYYVETPFWNVDTIFYTDINLEKAIPKYIFYCLQKEHLEQYNNAGGVPSLTQTILNKVKIPVPPLEIQREIVRILDNFTELTAELTAELAARKKQYEYYRDYLLSFGVKTEWTALEKIAELGTGSHNTNEELEIGNYPFYVRSQDIRRLNTFDFDETAIITSGDGVGVGKIFHYVEGKYALHQRAYRIHVTSEKVLPKFLYQYMKATFLGYIEKAAFNSSVTSIRRPMLNAYPVPVPPLDVQERIVNVLDNFEKICKDLSIGLPAEIEARKKQYEYYRDALLSFDPNIYIYIYEAREEWRLGLIKILQYVFGYITVKLADLFETRNGFTPSKTNSNFWINADIPWFRLEDIRENGHILGKAIQYVSNAAAKDTPFPENSIIVSTSATIGEHALVTCPFLANQRFTCLMLKDEWKEYCNIKYLFYYCFKLDEFCKKHLNTGNFASVDMSQFYRFSFTIPTLAEQERIVSVLDRFDVLCNDITEGLPAEIATRQKQYEYYRDKLLNFN